MSYVLRWCDKQDQLSKGESPTTKAVREAYAKDEAQLTRHGECVCNTGPGTDGPDEFCPQHGRPYTDLLRYLDEVAHERDALRVRNSDGPAF